MPASTRQYFKPGRLTVPESLPTVQEHLKVISQSLNMTIGGQDNSSFALTLDPTATSYNLQDPRISKQTCISFMPITAAAAAAKPSIWVEYQTSGIGGAPQKVTAIVHYSAAAGSDCRYICSISG